MRTFIVILFLFTCFFVISCSSQSNPSSPSGIGKSGEIIINEDTLIPVGVSDYFPDGNPSGGEGLLGLFSLHLDKTNITADLSPLRGSSAVDTLEVVDITNFLSLSPCTDCAKIKSVSSDPDGKLVLSIGIRHPFPAGDPFKPITGKNRADLHVFNVEGIIISNTAGISFPGLGETISGVGLSNADGYTGYLDASFDSILPTDATIHPYIMHFDDYSAGNYSASNLTGFESVTNPAPSGNLVMPMGSDYDYKDYVFDLPTGVNDFIFAIGCTYGVSSNNKALRFSPEYRVPQHNKKAASEVSVEIVTNNLKGADTASTADLAVKVLDISHGVPVGTNLDEMFADSSVGEISIDIPGVTSTPVVQTSFTPTGNGRDPADPLSFPITIINTSGALEGTYTGLVKVKDTYLPGQNTSPLLNGMDGIKRVQPTENPLTGTFAIDEFATYAIFTIDVAIQQLLEACFTADPMEARLEVDATINFDASCSNDPNGYNIVSFDWDFDWDGIPANFVSDLTTSIPTTSFLYTSAGLHTVALKVTNDAPVPQTSAIFSDNIIIHGWTDPIKLTDSTVRYTDMWWCVDIRMAATSDGRVHAFVKNVLQDYTNNMDYLVLDENGIVSSQTVFNFGISDMGIITTPTDDIYLFYMNYNGDIAYIKNSGSGFGSEVIAMGKRTGYYSDHAGYAVNQDGDIAVLMSEYGDCPTPADISYSVNEGSGFSAKTVITTVDRWIQCNGTGGTGVGITVSATADSTGTFYLAWDGLPAYGNSARDIWFASYNGSLSPPSYIANSGGDDFFPLMRVDADDTVWCGYRTSENMLAKKPAASTSFEPGFTVAGYPANNWSFDINPATGAMMQLWTQRDTSAGNEYHLWSKIYNTADTPTDMRNALEFRLDDSVDTRQWWPQVTYSSDGHWYALWDDQRNLGGPTAMGDLFFAIYY